jgi:hypothetical protein
MHDLPPRYPALNDNRVTCRVHTDTPGLHLGIKQCVYP